MVVVVVETVVSTRKIVGLGGNVGSSFTVCKGIFSVLEVVNESVGVVCSLVEVSL